MSPALAETFPQASVFCAGAFVATVETPHADEVAISITFDRDCVAFKSRDRATAAR